MSLSEEITELIGQLENNQLDYKAVLPPARTLAQMIAGFANSGGGFIVLGVFEANRELRITGLSEDFHAINVVHKAIDSLSPRPIVSYDYVIYKEKRLYVIKVLGSNETISIEGKIYRRVGKSVVVDEPDVKVKLDQLTIIRELIGKLTDYSLSSSGAKSKFLDHYLSVLNIIGDLGAILYPVSPEIATFKQEGKILSRILFSSCADNFEIYLTDLLYEIYLAKPDTLKSTEQVTIKEVLDCSDIQEFVLYWAKKKLSKLQRGSVKGFIADNAQIKGLSILGNDHQNEIEKILQIRHLYAHRNGIVDEKFLQFYPGQYNLNDAHELNVKDMLTHFAYLLEVVDALDKAAIKKYQLATL